MRKNKKIRHKDTYTVERITYSDGSSQLTRTCDGFNPIELLGVLELAQLEIVDQIKGAIKPDIIKRKVIVRK